MTEPRRLSDATLGEVPASVEKPAYDRAATSVGVVHFGPGAFHRAHQAWYFDRMLARDPSLAICAVSLRSDAVRAALEPQDGLYSLVEREVDPSIRIIGSLKVVLNASENAEPILQRLSDPAIRIVTATVTEKGYNLTPAGDLEVDHPDIQADLAAPEHPGSLIGCLTEGLRRRRIERLAPFVAVSCDNLSDNGARLRRAVVQFAAARGETELARWIEAEAKFPSTMVDSITPATDEALRQQVAGAIGLVDTWPVQRERFVQWVIEDALGVDAQTFAEAGVTLTNDVAAFERAKLRLLNGAHSTLAYVGLRLGCRTVAEAMADAVLAPFVEGMMRQDVAPTLSSAEGLDAPAYIADILRRFRNPAIGHRLSQIAWDGSQKLPFRLLAPIAEALAAGRSIDRLVVGVAAWMVFVRDQSRAGRAVTDPLAEPLSAIGLACDGDSTGDVARFLKLESVFPRPLAANPAFYTALQRAYAGLSGEDPREALAG